MPARVYAWLLASAPAVLAVPGGLACGAAAAAANAGGVAAMAGADGAGREAAGAVAGADTGAAHTAEALADAAAPPPIIVTGRPLPQTPGLGAYATRVIGPERLDTAASGRLEDVLRDVAGFQQFRRIDSRTANPSTQGATLRGLGGNASARALVLLDGVPQGDPFAGWIPWSALAPERLALARIKRGGGSGPFGSGAVAGVIELESAARGDRPAISGRVLAGSRDSLEALASLTPAVGGGFLALDTRLDRGDGFVIIPRRQRGPIDIPAEYRVWSVSGRLVAPLGAAAEAQVRLAAFRDERVRGLPGADNLAEGKDVSVRFLRRGDWEAEALGYVQWRNFATVARSANAARTAATTTLDQFRTPADGWGGKVELRPALGEGRHLRLGADWRAAEGATNERFAFVSGAPTRLRQAGGRSRSIGAFLEADAEFGPLLLTGGVRADHWRLSDGRLQERVLATGLPTQLLSFPGRSDWDISARGGARLQPVPSLALRVAGYTGFRLPTLNELYRPFRVGADATASNPELAPERIRGVDGGLEWTPLPQARLTLTGFYNRLEGAIANVTIARGPGNFPQVGFVTAAGVFRQRQNLDAVRATGLELEASARSGIVQASASYALTSARVEASGIAAALDGRRPAQTPLHQLSATLGVAPRWASLALTIRHTAQQSEDDLGQRRLPSATTLDLVARVPLGQRVALVARAENLLDEEVVSGVSATDIRDLAQPRTFWAGASLAF